jgi:hypothetical protein
MSQGRTTLTAPPAARAALAARAPAPATNEAPKSYALRPGGRLRLAAKALKVSLVLDPAAIAGCIVSNQARVEFAVAVDGRTVRGSLNAKSVKKAVAAIAEHGADGVAVVLQGKLAAGDVLEEAGLSAQVKVPKPVRPAEMEATR